MRYLFCGSLCHFCLLFFMLSRLFIAAMWSPAGKGLTSWLLFVMFNCVFVTFPCGTCIRIASWVDPEGEGERQGVWIPPHTLGKSQVAIG